MDHSSQSPSRGTQEATGARCPSVRQIEMHSGGSASKQPSLALTDNQVTFIILSEAPAIHVVPEWLITRRSSPATDQT